MTDIEFIISSDLSILKYASMYSHETECQTPYVLIYKSTYVFQENNNVDE